MRRAPLRPAALLRLIVCLVAALGTAPAEAATRVLQFTPTGSVKAPRQVAVRFSGPMVPFGDPRLTSPFEIDCPVPGAGRWVDGSNWVYDFERDLPGGLRCRFTLRPDHRDLAGEPLAGPRTFDFDTGGPTVLQSEPWEGSSIDEAQIFLLGLDAPATRASVESNARCRAAGVVEAIPVEVITGEARRSAIETNPWFARRYASALFRDRFEADFVARSAADEAAVRARFDALLHGDESPLVVLRCRQRLPHDAKMWLDWGAGIETPDGLRVRTAQSLAYEVRPEFRADFRCQRARPDAKCIPVLGMRLVFTAPVARELAARVTLEAGDGKRHLPEFEGEREAPFVNELRFAGPLPARTRYTLRLPEGLVDDAGRALTNAAAFPLRVETDEDPPLAKFAASFGIVELNAEPALPVTVRNLEPNIMRSAPPPAPPPPSVAGFVDELARETFGLDKAAPEPPLATASIRGRVLKVPADDVAAITGWFAAVERARRDEWAWDETRREYVVKRRAGETEVLRAARDAMPLAVPRAAPAKSFEVIGIPLREPGFYVVELASPRLGANLFGRAATYYVQSLALVTNLGVHLKLGRESSLAWVTALDSGRPVAGAEVEIRDCAGRVHWHGRTDEDGIARIDTALPPAAERPDCDWNSRGFVALARAGADIGFVASHWNEGIASWQFGLPAPGDAAPRLVSTVFDRPLFRRGETVHMKHVLRRHGSTGFAAWKPDALELRIRHEGSGDNFPVQATARDGSGASEWTVPEAAKLGSYAVELRDGEEWLPAGKFRVEAFRVPLLRADVQPRELPLVARDALTLDVQVNYLAGGPAADLPVAVRGALRERAVSFPDYADYTFANGDVREGVTEHAAEAWRANTAESGGERLLAMRETTLDATGGARIVLDDLGTQDRPLTLVADLEYRDPNGETQSSGARVPLWPAKVLVGLKPEGWALSRERVHVQAVALDLDGAPLAGIAVDVDLFERRTYSHRKRLVGGFYAYEHRTEVRRLDAACAGRTDAHGLVDCTIASPVSGNVVVRARARDAEGRESVAHRDVWVAGEGEWWYGVGDHDRMDLVPERRRYEPGETARLQVRMPFREAQALVTVEREGVLEAFVTPLSGRSPVIELPMRGALAPNAFVSVLAVRGRDSTVQPTALVDLGRPAWKLGMTELRVGWDAHRLEVQVVPERERYRVREEAVVDVSVRRADGGPLGTDAEIALAAVDEGLLELAPNDSWALLDAMMGRRGIEVQTATAQMQVIGRRHYGRKAVAPGGGGGSGAGSRTLFDTLLAWRPHVKLDARGRARVTVPLNDALSSFRIVAVATAGDGHFGTGAATIRSTQDLMLFSGLPERVRTGDSYRASFTVRNAGEQPLDATLAPSVVTATAEVAGDAVDLPPQRVTLAPGSARELSWDYLAPATPGTLAWIVSATAGEAADRLEVRQHVAPALEERTLQAALLRLDAPRRVELARPADAVGAGLDLRLAARLVDGLDGVRDYFADYPYRCLEQRISRAVALRDEAQWRELMDALPSHLDADGLAKYFATPAPGSEVLSAYLLAIAAEAGWAIPEPARVRLRTGLVGFVEGRVARGSPLSAADLVLRKLAAIDALSRQPEGLVPGWLESLDAAPARWPNSAVIDYIGLLRRSEDVPGRDARLAEALAVLRARLALQGGALRLADAHGAPAWWLMGSPDVDANRALLAVLDHSDWAADVPALVAASLQRQRGGHWDTTTANAWGVLALERYSARFEAMAVTGSTSLRLGTDGFTAQWAGDASHEQRLAWEAGTATLEATHAGTGAPWLAVQGRAALALTTPLAAGYRVERSVTPVRQAGADGWRRGDVYRVRLDVDAASEMTWVVVSDPLPPGAVVLSGAPGGEPGSATPAFEERGPDAWRAYFDHLPQGRWRLEYTVRLNHAGEFRLPPTRAEAMYAPSMFGETPNAPLVVGP